jgi:hypothetical protein
MNNESERVCIKVVAYSKVLSRNLPGDIEENNEENLVKLLGVRARIRTEYQLNTSQKHYRLIQFARFHVVVFLVMTPCSPVGGYQSFG